LLSINSPSGNLETAKCDAWATTEMNVEDEIFAASWKFGSYVDILFFDSPSRFSFAAHESLVERTSALLKKSPEIPASAELLVRLCYFYNSPQRQPDNSPQEQHDNSPQRQPEVIPSEGFFMTSYVFGYGDDEGQARKQWSIALRLLGNALLQAT